MITRSFRKDYVRMLKLSEPFMKDAYEAFNNFFYNEQKQLIRFKIEKIFAKFRNYLQRTKEPNDCFEMQLIRFLNSTNLQFPWSIQQIIEAEKTIYNVLSNY